MVMSAIFAKPIDRPIEGVIKADDEASLRTEVEEYILTNELARRMEEFLGAYTHYTNANGVWISGFFGSGKSHLLKMLALLLENRLVEGERVLDLFLAKEEVKNNSILRGDLIKAAAIPSKSILFNIDQKADVISKTQIDALLAVFVKVFDETCGYYGKQGYIAQFERDLDSRGQYAAFKEAYRSVAGKPWERGREQSLLEGRNIAAAYAAATGAPPGDAQGILDKYRSQYRVSIEDFAKEVDAYIRRQGPDFRLNFFVDEAGQYIANNVKLMTNLQTIAESLASKSRGRAWILVTAQDEMDDVVGEMSRDTANDFSKIQARFATRMKLTSADVAEVVRRRLLQKNARGIDLATELYEAEQNNFKTLFDFGDGSQTYRNFRSREEFIDSYPFVSYQFPLFQAALRGLSEHNAFEGKHRSVGERSLLAVFQQVAVRMEDQPVGALATFDLMFEGIRSALKAQSQAAILTAENHLENKLAVQALKALFLVKYVREFKGTLRNLHVLLLPGFGVDLLARRKGVEEALNLLEQQTYVQRVGDEYEFLTNEEKDVEQEIKNTEVASDAVAAQLNDLFFEEVVKSTKIRYEGSHGNGQDYAYARKVDGQLQGRDQELAINLVTPFHEHAGNLTVIKAQSMGRAELLVVLPPSDRLLADLLLYKRADKYIRQNLTTAQVESVRRILHEKQSQNTQRLARLRAMLIDLASQATLVVDGQELIIGGSDARGRVFSGFSDLVVRTYPHLAMLRGIPYSENDLAGCLRPDVTLFGESGGNLSEAEGDLLGHIQLNQQSGLRTTLQSLVTRYGRKPYGWSLAAVQCHLARLYARGKIELRRDSNLLEDAALEAALRNTHDFAGVIIIPQVEFSAAQVRKLKEFYGEYFGSPAHGNEAKALAQETAAAFGALRAELAPLAAQVAVYPFLAALEAPLGALRALEGKAYTFYLADLPAQMEALLDAKEGIVDPIRRFMQGSQRQIFADAQHFLGAHGPNFAYVADEQAAQLRAILQEPGVYAGHRMQAAKTLLDGLRASVGAAVAAERAAALAKVDDLRQRLAASAGYGDLTPAQREALEGPFRQLEQALAPQELIAVLRDQVRHFEENKYVALGQKLAEWLAPVPVEGGGSDRGNGGSGGAPPRVAEYVSAAQLFVPFPKGALAGEEDVDQYLAALRAAMLAAIANGKQIRLA